MACALAGAVLTKTAANNAAKRNVHRAEFMGSPHREWLTILREPRKFHCRALVPRSKSGLRLQNEDCEYAINPFECSGLPLRWKVSGSVHLHHVRSGLAPLAAIGFGNGAGPDAHVDVVERFIADVLH